MVGSKQETYNGYIYPNFNFLNNVSLAHIYRTFCSAICCTPSPAKRLVVEYKCQLATTFTDILKAQLQVVD
jgi:hypothetical protein